MNTIIETFLRVFQKLFFTVFDDTSRQLLIFRRNDDGRVVHEHVDLVFLERNYPQPAKT